MLNPVSVTKAKTGTVPFLTIFVSIHRVPANKVHYFPSSIGLYLLLFICKGVLRIGIDSPVSMASLTIH